MAKNKIKPDYITLNKTQLKNINTLWRKARTKALKLGGDVENKMMSGEYDLRMTYVAGKLNKTDIYYNKYIKDFNPNAKLTLEGYNRLISQTKDFLQPDWEQRQVERMINNLANAVKSVFAEDMGNSYTDRVIGKTASHRASYLKSRLKGLSYEELLYITGHSDLLEVVQFYLSSKESAEETWKNLLSSISKLRKEYKKRGK